MYIKRLTLTNFRNFTDVEEIAFPENSFLVAAAPNATGKTNFLEALTMLLRGKSFRASTEECVRWGADSFVVQGEVVSQSGEAQIAVRYHVPTRKLRIEENGVPASPVTFFSHYPYILFLPDDTNLLLGSPAQRRNFLNQVLVSSPSYLSAVVQYHRALKQRNALLKTAGSYQEVEAWTHVLAEHSVPVWKQRETLVRFMGHTVPEIYQLITGEHLTLDVQLLTSVTPSEYSQKLAESFSFERRFGYTLHGPHRDDVTVMLHHRPVRAALSRGQLRSVVIALKLAAFRYIKNTVGEQPILLLDEVLSELDESRQVTLLQNLPAAQILLTCTQVPKILHQRDNVHLLDLRSITEPTPVPEVTPPPTTPEEERGPKTVEVKPEEESVPLRVSTQ